MLRGHAGSFGMANCNVWCGPVNRTAGGRLSSILAVRLQRMGHPSVLGGLGKAVRAFARMPTSQNRDMGHPILRLQPDVGHPAVKRNAGILRFARNDDAGEWSSATQSKKRLAMPS